jgi:hypothetical protein
MHRHVSAGWFTILLLTGAIPAAAQQDVDPRVAALLEQVSPDRLRTTVERLAGFATRHTLSSQDARTPVTIATTPD